MQNHDGFIDIGDLRAVYTSMGREMSDKELNEMIGDAVSDGKMNFTMFLTMFGERLSGTDPEDVIRNAFGCFDEADTGYINTEVLRELMTSMGERFTDEEVDDMLRGAPVDKNDNLNYVEFTRILKNGQRDEDEEGS